MILYYNKNNVVYKNNLYYFFRMILFYSDYCKHCNVLLETIKRHDKNNIVKLVSIDTLRSLNKAIDPKIHSVPALLLTNTKEYMFGKTVFDYLLLPNRGVLFSNNIRDTKNKDDVNINKENIGEPMAFSMNANYSDNFSSFNDDGFVNDESCKWGFLDGKEESVQIDTPVNDVSSGKKNLPTMEDIIKQRANDLV